LDHWQRGSSRVPRKGAERSWVLGL
jgi:hypothetical protein